MASQYQFGAVAARLVKALGFAALVFGAAIFGLSRATAAAAPDRGVTVVELFTSQGCNSCPPANANLIRLMMEDPSLLLLSFSVTYWDRLGWKDSFGHEDYSRRQYDYEPKLGEANAFTPQMVINGQISLVGNHYAGVQKAIARAGQVDSSAIILEANRLTIAAQIPAIDVQRAEVWLVRFEPGVLAVPVLAGENSGVTLPHGRVVRELTLLGEWRAKQVFSQTLPPSPNLRWRTAVLLQNGRGGSILAAAQ